MVAIIDPLGRSAQRLTPVLLTMRAHFNMDLKIILLPNRQLTEIPLKAFSRFRLDSIKFDANTGAMLADAGATFMNLPQSRVRTSLILFRWVSSLGLLFGALSLTEIHPFLSSSP